jgi:hypothetical protein
MVSLLRFRIRGADIGRRIRLRATRSRIISVLRVGARVWRAVLVRGSLME